MPSPQNTHTQNPKQQTNEQGGRKAGLSERASKSPSRITRKKKFLPRGMINCIFAYQLLQGKTVAQENKHLLCVPPVEPRGRQVRAQLMYNLYLPVKKNPLFRFLIYNP